MAETVVPEMENALLKSERPSSFFEKLRETKQLPVWFPEAAGLIGVPQNSAFHPEGDVWTHTMQVIDEAAGMRKEASEPLRFMLAALCHDYGKQVSTSAENDAVHAYHHEKEGLPLVRSFLERITKNSGLTEYVLNMTSLHMEPNQMVRNGSHIKAYMKMFDRSVAPKDLLLLAKADYLGRIGMGTDRKGLLEEYEKTENILNEMLLEYKNRMSSPCISENDLINAGIQPGPILDEALTYVHKLRLAGVPKEEQLRHTLGMFRKQIQ